MSDIRDLGLENQKQMMLNASKSLMELLRRQQESWQFIKSFEFFPGMIDQTGLYPSQDIARGLTINSSIVPSENFNAFFIGHIPEGELKSITLSFRKKLEGFVSYTTGPYIPGFDHGPGRLDIEIYYPDAVDRNDGGEVISSGFITIDADPVDFEPINTPFDFDGGQITRPDEALYVNIMTTSNEGEAKHFLNNVERMNITMVFGSFDYGEAGEEQ